MKSTKLKIAGQTGNAEKSWCWYSGSKRDPQAEFYLPWGKSVFFLLRPLTDWMRPTHIMNGNLFYSKSVGGVVQSLSRVQLFDTSWTAAQQVPLSFTIFQSLLKLMSIESMMPSNHLVLCHPFFLLPSIFPNIKVFSKESALHIRWPKCWSFSFRISPSNEYSELISFRTD